MINEYCNCNYLDHVLNHNVESYVGYINPTLNLYKSNNINFATIISIESFLYEYNSNLIIELQNNILIIRNYLINNNNNDNKLQKFINNIRNIINKSPIVDHNIIVYRGIDKQLNINIGDILIEKNFVFTSIHIKYAVLFLNNTSNCYINGRIDTTKIKYTNKINTLFKINIPPYYHFFENTHVNDINILSNRSEIILDCNTKFKVSNIFNTNKYILVEVNII